MHEITSSTFHRQEGGQRVVTLRIEVHSKTAWEMADLLNFSPGAAGAACGAAGWGQSFPLAGGPLRHWHG